MMGENEWDVVREMRSSNSYRAVVLGLDSDILYTTSAGDTAVSSTPGRQVPVRSKHATDCLELVA